MTMLRKFGDPPSEELMRSRDDIRRERIMMIIKFFSTYNFSKISCTYHRFGHLVRLRAGHVVRIKPNADILSAFPVLDQLQESGLLVRVVGAEHEQRTGHTDHAVPGALAEPQYLDF